MLKIDVAESLEDTLKPEAVRACGVYLGALGEEISSLSLRHERSDNSVEGVALHQWTGEMVTQAGDSIQAQMTSESALIALETCLARLRRSLLRKFKSALS